MEKNERNGLVAALVSSALGGCAGALTRYVVGGGPAFDPIALAAFRFGIAFVIMLPIALGLRSRWPQGRDWAGVAALGILFFCVFFVLYNVALGYTSAARGSLALSTLPLATMLVGALIGVEALTRRKTLGVLIAIGGVALALGAGLASAPRGAWRGDLVMVGATLLMAVYSVWSRRFVSRSSPLGFLTAGMGFGAAASVLIAWQRGGFDAMQAVSAHQWSRRRHRGARRRRFVLPVGLRARAHNADAGDQHDDDQPGFRVAARGFPYWRAAGPEPGAGDRGGGDRDLDRVYRGEVRQVSAGAAPDACPKRAKHVIK